MRFIFQVTRYIKSWQQTTLKNCNLIWVEYSAWNTNSISNRYTFLRYAYNAQFKKSEKWKIFNLKMPEAEHNIKQNATILPIPTPPSAFLYVIRDYVLPLALAMSARTGILPQTYPS
jgi:hypothetical protein